MGNDNTAKLLSKFTRKLGVKLTETQLSAELEKHPDNPSLLAFVDVLTWFGVECGSYRVPADELSEVPVPFIAHTKKNGNFAMVWQIKHGQVHLADSRRRTMPLDDFKKVYQGVVLVAETPEQSVATKPALIDRLGVFRIPAAIILLVICFIAALSFSGTYGRLNWQLIALTLIKTGGLAVSCLLLLQSIDKNNPLVQTLCGGEGKTNCNAILTSKAATVFKGLTWSEVGFFYFVGSWLALLFLTRAPGVLPLLAILNILSLPYTVYSINYQARIAKQWCRFCIIIQAVLWLEFAAFLPTFINYQTSVQSFSILTILKLGLILVLPAALWLLIKPLILKGQQLDTLKNQLKRFKYNRGLFESSLKAQPKCITPDKDWSIVFGNPKAETIITMVSNPYCQPCATIHNELDEWTEKLENLQLRVVFNADNGEKDKKTLIARHLMELSRLPDKTIIKRALHDWYNQKQKNYEAWAKAYPVALDESKFHVLETQRVWCDKAQIKATPTLFVNGYRLPKVYRAADIKYLLQGSN